MTTSHDDIATADKLGRKRARILPVLALLFLLQQGAFFSATPETQHLVRTVDLIKIGAWITMSLALLSILWTGGMTLRGHAVRHLLNDEVSRANRSNALEVGFFCSMLAALSLYAISSFADVSALEAIHTVVTAGIVPALLRFGLLERRAWA
jgi:hypothetical protein